MLRPVLFPPLAAMVIAVLAISPLRGAMGASDGDYLAELIARARAQHLAESRDWHTLLHYQPRLLGGVSSLIDSPGFFAAADGKTDPQAELEATLASFFAPPPPPGAGQPVQCLRIARYRWLKAELNFDPARLEEQACPEFDEWYRVLNPAQITLAYPSAHLNNPSSMFGHTLLRIDRPDQTEQTRLLSFAINFAAETGPEGGALFAIKGLAGGYRGYFSVLPFYEKVTQYNDIENRDIWEYQLDLSPSEMRRMLEHLWELEGQWVTYYFLSTNCSYLLLALINTARPDLDLMHGLDIYAIPVDTVRNVIRENGLLKATVYRPSGETKIRHLRDDLGEPGGDLALALATGERDVGDPELGTLPRAEQARVLELAQSMLQYRLNTGALAREEVAPRSLRLLRARAAIPVMADAAGADAARGDAARGDAAGRRIEPPAVRPDQGHESVRLAGGFGMTGSNPFIEVGLRPAYHDLLDPGAGYPAGAEIEILGGRIRYYPGEVPRLEDFTPVGIKSLSPRDDFFQPISWRTKVGIERFRDDAGDAGWLVGVIEGAAGGTWSLGGGAAVSTLLGASLFGDRDWPEDRIGGLGPELGLSVPINAWWTTRLEARWQAVAGSDRLSDRYGVQFGQGFELDRNLSLRVDVGVRNDGGEAFAEWTSSLHWYF